LIHHRYLLLLASILPAAGGTAVAPVLPPLVGQDDQPAEIQTAEHIRNGGRIALTIEAQVEVLEEAAAADGIVGQTARSALSSLREARSSARAWRRALARLEEVREQLRETDAHDQGGLDEALDEASREVVTRAIALDGALRASVSSSGRRPGGFAREYLSALRPTLEFLPESPERRRLDEGERLLRQVGVALLASLERLQEPGMVQRELFDLLAAMGAVTSTNPQGVLLPSESAQIDPTGARDLSRRFGRHLQQLDVMVQSRPKAKKLRRIWSVIQSLEDRPWSTRDVVLDHQGVEYQGTVGELLTIFLGKASELCFDADPSYRPEELRILGRQFCYVLDEQIHLRSVLAASE
jgi:hypothetical protein